MKHILYILAALLLVSCGTAREATKSYESKYQTAQRLDSIFRASLARDSIYVHDSVYVREKGDTVYHYAERVQYQYVERHDTIYRNVVKVDTVYSERTDTTTVVRTVSVEKPVKWYNQGFIWLGRLCCLAVIFWALFLYLKRKF